MFKKRELLHWLITQSVQLPIEQCIKQLEQQKNLALLRVDEIKQILRIFELFGRFDLTLVTITLTALPYPPELTRQLRLADFENIHTLLQASSQLKQIADLKKWPVSENDFKQSVPSQIFSDELISAFENHLLNKIPNDKKIENSLLQDLLPHQSQLDLLSHTNNTIWIDHLSDLRFRGQHTRQALLQNPIFIQKKKQAFDCIRKKDQKDAFAVMQNPLVDYSVAVAKNYHAAFQAGWKPGRLFALYLKFNSEYARRVLASLPVDVQADLVLFTHMTYGVATPHLLGSIVNDEKIKEHLFLSQQLSLEKTTQLANSPSTSQEIPPYVLGAILNYSSDKINQQIRGYTLSRNCRLIDEHIPSTAMLRVDIQHVKRSLHLELEALLCSIRSKIWADKVPFYTRLKKVAQILSVLPYLVVVCAINAFLFSEGTYGFLHFDYGKDQTDPLNTIYADIIISSLIYLAPGVLFSLIGFFAGYRLRGPLQAGYINADSLSIRTVRKNQTQLQESAQLIGRLVRSCSNMECYRLSFLLFEEIQQQLEVIKAVCEFIRNYQAGGDTLPLKTLLQQQPFLSETITYLPQNKLQAFDEFFDSISHQSLLNVNDDADLRERITRYSHEHPVTVEMPFWRSWMRREISEREHDNDVELRMV